jgi:hypothetical protein
MPVKRSVDRLPSRAPAVSGQDQLGSVRSQVMQLLYPPRPPAGWLGVSVAVLATGMLLLAILLIMGYRLHDWPAHYLQDYMPGTWFSGGCLAMSAVLCFITARNCPLQRRRRFWMMAAATLLLVSADDMFRLHEMSGNAIDRWLSVRRGVEEHWGIENWIVASYGIVALWYSWRRRDELLRMPWTTYCLAIAFVLFGGMVACDVAELSATLEDTFKTISVLFILIGCLAAYMSVRAEYDSAEPQ